jgi:hypothetical protein
MAELVAFGCSLAQGFLFCPAVRADTIVDILRDGMLVAGGPHASVAGQTALIG